MAVMILILFMQSYEDFVKRMNETWTELEPNFNTTRRYDIQDAPHCYDTMWLGALALDLADKELKKRTPCLTLSDFNYTGENSNIIRKAIYDSARRVNFTGATVSDHQWTPLEQ